MCSVFFKNKHSKEQQEEAIVAIKCTQLMPSFLPFQASESDYKLPDSPYRYFSTFSAPKNNGSKFGMRLNLRHSMLAFSRLESTVAATDSSEPPSEKYEYQAEVCQMEVLMCSFIYQNNTSHALF